MNKSIENIDYKWLTHPTGDPFADTGGYVIEYLAEKDPEKDILELIEDVTNLYVNNWNAKINAFFLNSKITQPAFKSDRKISETVKYYENLIDNEIESENGFCRLSGENTQLFCAGRDNTLLSGSGTFVNFHHCFQEGIMLSKEMLIRMHFIPLGTILLEGKVAVIISNDKTITKYFIEQNIKNNFQKIAVNSSDIGVVKSEYNNPANAIFSFVDSVIHKTKLYKEIENPISLRLFHFTNFGANPEVKIYQIPATVFAFYAFCTQGKYLKDWNCFIRSQYFNSKHKGAVYNLNTECFEEKKKGEKKSTDINVYKTWTNFVYDRLLKGISILKDFMRWSRRHKIDFKIIEVYQEKIGFMKKETIEKIKEMANFITQNENEDVIKKSIKALDGARNPYLLRRFIIKNLVAENYTQGNEKALVSLDDYVNYLFPDGNSWQEIRDMLIIAIYQNMHKLNLNIEIELLEEDTVE